MIFMCLEKALEFSLRKPELTQKFIHSCGSMEYFEMHTNHFYCTKCSGRVIEQCLFYVCRSLNKCEIEQADMLDIGQSNSMAPNYTTSYVYIYIYRQLFTTSANNIYGLFGKNWNESLILKKFKTLSCGNHTYTPRHFQPNPFPAIVQPKPETVGRDDCRKKILG